MECETCALRIGSKGSGNFKSILAAGRISQADGSVLCLVTAQVMYSRHDPQPMVLLGHSGTVRGGS
jgi:hypothetical protein